MIQLVTWNIEEHDLTAASKRRLVRESEYE